ncbi:hypothetical protein HY504_00025 [Candidatus Wolfebacteria bacterium]|nr:hypothetical protein [Candidatus Wolfebacteria bacterium]
MKILKNPLSREEVVRIAEEQYGDRIKAVVDIGKGILALGGELHMDAAALLEDSGSSWKNLWGINVYPAEKESRIEFDSMVNIKPASGNRSRYVDDSAVREKIETIVRRLIL